MKPKRKTMGTTLSPNQRRLARWVEALRSGNYEQGKGRLKSLTGQYCCLGVYCELYRPKDIALRMAMPDANVLSDDADWELASLNDGGVPFEVIAGIIHHNFVVPS